jgi:hypothetical protein
MRLFVNTSPEKRTPVKRKRSASLTDTTTHDEERANKKVASLPAGDGKNASLTRPFLFGRDKENIAPVTFEVKQTPA